MKHRIAAIALIVIVLTACAPSVPTQPSIDLTVIPTHAWETAVAQATLNRPTVTVIPSPTKNLDFEYLSKFIGFLNDWGQAFSKFHDADTRITNEGIGIMNDTNFQTEIVSSLTALDQASKQMVNLNPSSPAMQPLKKKAESLQAYTETFTSLYLSSIAGNQASKTIAVDAIKNASSTFTELVDDVQKEILVIGASATQVVLPTDVVIAVPTDTAAPINTAIPTATVYIPPAQPTAAGHPPGTSGQCVDESYTSAQHKQGACSHHGGVSIWWGP